MEWNIFFLAEIDYFDTSSYYITISLILSCISILLTLYFWYIKNNRERARLDIVQAARFRSDIKSKDAQNKTIELSFYQNKPDVFIANHSILPNAVLKFSCYLKDGSQWIKGESGYMGDNPPPWNISPTSAIRIHITCTFKVKEDFQVRDDVQFKVNFQCLKGNFSKIFTYYMIEEE